MKRSVFPSRIGRCRPSRGSVCYFTVIRRVVQLLSDAMIVEISEVTMTPTLRFRKVNMLLVKPAREASSSYSRETAVQD